MGEVEDSLAWQVGLVYPTQSLLLVQKSTLAHSTVGGMAICHGLCDIYNKMVLYSALLLSCEPLVTA